LDEIGLVVYEEMSFKVTVYGRPMDRQTDVRQKAITKAHPVELKKEKGYIITFFYHTY
jgi:hypothetical protein